MFSGPLSAQGGGCGERPDAEASFPTRWPGQGMWVLVEAVKFRVLFFFFFSCLALLPFLPGTPMFFAFFLTRSLTREPEALPLAGRTARYKQAEGSAWRHTLCLLNKTDKFSLLREEALQLSIPQS